MTHMPTSPVIYRYSLRVSIFLIALILTGTSIYVYSNSSLISSPESLQAHAQLPLANEPTPPSTPNLMMHQYIQIIDGCEIHLSQDCVNAYREPREDALVVAQLRKGTILKVSQPILENNRVWYKIEFDEWLRYPERVSQNWYVAAEHTRVFKDTGVEELSEAHQIASTTKVIIIDRSDQTLYALENDTLFMQETISTGLAFTPTPRGTFTVYKKTPTRYMQGPLPGISAKYYDLPGVPWNLYFTKQGGVIHGTYWHDKFGQPWSNGCVNVDTDHAEKLYQWADLGTPVIVRD